MINRLPLKKWMQSIHSAVQSATTFRFSRLRAARLGSRVKVLSFEGLEVRELFAVGDLRMVTYNVLGGDGTPSSDLGTILQAIGSENYNGRQRAIDVLAIQEVRNQSTTTANVVAQLNSIYGAGVYARGNFNGAGTSGSGTVGLVYNTQTVQLLGEVGVGTPSTNGQPRQTIRYQLQPVGLPAGNDFYLYNSHYKASDTADDRARRLVEAQAIRANADALGNDVHIIYAGDFNTYSSSEPGFQTIIGAGNGQARDPVNRLGSWSDNNSFRDVHTQAPSTSPPPGFAAGGLDDRFDFQLLSYEWFDGVGLDYLTGSYHTFANNGSVPLNGSINSPSNTAIPGLANRSTILNLLTTVSDHLPVVVDYFFNNNTNTPPTDVNLDNAVVAENSPIGAPVGNLSTVDADFGDSFTYSLVGGTGSTDNVRFSIVGNQLRTAQAFNYESQNAYSVRVRSTDSQGEFFEEIFTISIADVNEAPIDISLSEKIIDENLPSDTFIGLFESIDPDVSNTFSYQLVSGEGDADNANFNLVGNQLRTATTFNYEVKSSYSIRVRVTDQGALFFEKSVLIDVADVNDTPTAYIIAPTNVNQFQSIQSLGFADDEDTAQVHEYEWDFDYDGLTFQTDAVGDSPTFSYITAGVYVIALRVRDNGQPILSDIETATINVNALPNTAPSISSIGNQSINANSSTGALAFIVGDSQTPADNLVVTVSSNNPVLVPVENIVLGGSGANRTVNATPTANLTGAAVITLTVSDGTLTTSTTFNVVVNPVASAPRVDSVTLGDGTAQRSMVKTITVRFDSIVSIDANAFELRRRVGTTLTDISASDLLISVSATVISGKTVATLTFAGSSVIGGSLSDGNYHLTVRGDGVHSNGLDLDGDANGSAGGNYIIGANATDNFFRLYGDTNGNRNVNVVEFGQFRASNGSIPSNSNYRDYFDYQSNNAINILDFGQFRSRVGTTLPG